MDSSDSDTNECTYGHVALVPTIQPGKTLLKTDGCYLQHGKRVWWTNGSRDTSDHWYSIMRIIKTPFDTGGNPSHGMIWIGEPGYPLWDAAYNNPDYKTTHPQSVPINFNKEKAIKKFWSDLDLTNPQDPILTCQEISKIDTKTLINAGVKSGIVSTWNIWTPIAGSKQCSCGEHRCDDNDMAWAQMNGVNDDMTLYHEKGNPLVLLDYGSPNRVEIDPQKGCSFFSNNGSIHNFPYRFVELV